MVCVDGVQEVEQGDVVDLKHGGFLSGGGGEAVHISREAFHLDLRGIGKRAGRVPSKVSGLFVHFPPGMGEFGRAFRQGTWQHKRR